MDFSLTDMKPSLPFPEFLSEVPAPADDAQASAPVLDFESALAQLESLVARMEDGELPLEQSLAAYQQGMALARLCQSLLDRAEERVKVLQHDALVPYANGRDENAAD